ncbi:MAG: sigma factor-like helix-turn-helix DNA-binding protein [Bacteroidota bacterium]
MKKGKNTQQNLTTHGGMTHREIGKVLGISRSTVFNIEKAALKKLGKANRKMLKDLFT